MKKIKALQKKWPDNICLQVFDENYYNSLSKENQGKLLECMNSGIQNPDSGMGCYACRPDDYDVLKPFFKKALEKYHKVDLSKTRHRNNWSLAGK